MDMSRLYHHQNQSIQLKQDYQLPKDGKYATAAKHAFKSSLVVANPMDFSAAEELALITGVKHSSQQSKLPMSKALNVKDVGAVAERRWETHLAVPRPKRMFSRYLR